MYDAKLDLTIKLTSLTTVTRSSRVKQRTFEPHQFGFLNIWLT